MSKSIKTLEKNFKSKASLELSVTELKEENRALKETVTKLLAEVERLNGLDKKALPIDLSLEQQILEMQIAMLHQESMNRVLTLDETRKLDLHIKNKRLLEDKSTLNAEYTTLPTEISDAELMRIAENANTEEEKPKKSKRTKS